MVVIDQLGATTKAHGSNYDGASSYKASGVISCPFITVPLWSGTVTELCTMKPDGTFN